jgi:hypothetical protein
MDMLFPSKMHWPFLLASAAVLSWSVLQCAHAQGAGAADTAAQEHSLSVREFRDDAFRETDYHDPRFLDSRYHHDHYYPPVGFAFRALPSGYQQIYDPDGDLYFAGGVWYRKEQPGRYVVVSPEIGATVRVLPPHYATVFVEGVPYYYANHIYYLQAPDGYLVVELPRANAVVEQWSGNATTDPRPSRSATRLPAGRN